MIVLIQSAPDTPEARRAVKIARDTASDLVLLHDAVGLAIEGRLEGFCGAVHAMAEDIELRNMDNHITPDIHRISTEQLALLIASEEGVLGVF